MTSQMMRSRIIGPAIVAVAVVAITLAVVAGKSSGGSHGSSVSSLPLAPASTLGRLAPPPNPGRLGSEAVPVPPGPPLAPADAPAPGRTVDGIASTPSEQVAFHIHAHLTVFVAGAPRQVPYGIGIAPPVEVQSTPAGPFAAGGSGFSWLHAHAPDGIIHIESPVQRTYTLGNYFDVWAEPLGPNRVGPVTGPVTAFFNGRHYLGNPRDIPLVAHAQIQLDVGRPLVAPESVAYPQGL
jgi:hypothetical protein